MWILKSEEMKSNFNKCLLSRGFSGLGGQAGLEQRPVWAKLLWASPFYMFRPVPLVANAASSQIGLNKSDRLRPRQRQWQVCLWHP